MVKLIKSYLIFLLIILGAIFLRIYKLDYLELFGDEIDAGYQSYSLLTNASDYKGYLWPVYMQSFSEWRAPGLMYAMVPFIKLFGLNEWGVRLCPVFYGVLSIIGFYYLLLRLGVKKNVSLIAICLLSITPWHIQYSRTAFELTLMSSGLIWGSYFLIKGLRQNQYKLIIVAGISYCTSLYTYNTANIFVPLLALISIWLFKANKKQILVLFFTGLILALPLGFQIVYGHASDRFGSMSLFGNKEIIAKVNDYRNAGNNSIISKFLYNKITVASKQIVFNYSNAFGSNFLFKDGDVTFRHSLHQVGNLYWVELVLIVFGFVYLFRSKNIDIGNRWFLSLMLISPLPASLTIDGSNHASRLFLLVFPLTYFAALGLSKMSNWIKIVLCLLLIFEFINFQYYYWNFYRSESWRWWHVGYKESMQYVGRNQDSFQKVIMDNTYEPSLIRFLFWNQVNPKLVFNFADNNIVDIDGFDGYCLNYKFCFVNFANKFKLENMNKNILYMVSHEKNVGGDWYWNINPPSGMLTVKTVFNYQHVPIFYFVIKK